MTRPRLLLASAVALTLAASAPSALAQGAKAADRVEESGSSLLVEGTVVAIDGEEIMIDLGASKGATVGAKLALWRPLRLRHPVTGAAILDRFQIGSLEIVQTRAKLAVARASGKPLRAPAAGDIVVLEVPRPEPQAAKPPEPTAPAPLPPTASQPAPEPAPPTKSADAAAVVALLQSVAKKPPEVRVAAYEEFAREHPRSPYTRVLVEDARELRRAAVAATTNAVNAATRAGPQPEPPRLVLSATAPGEARANVPMAIALEVAPTFRGAMLHYRAAGARAYVSTPMRPMGARYFGATIPAAAVQTPGVEYFVEGLDDKGRAAEILGDAAAPKPVSVPSDSAVDAALGDKKERGFGVSVLSDYASFNVKKDNDTVWQTEAAFTLRLRDVGLRALRSGAGVYRGKGGTLDELDQKGLDARSVGLTYGWIEAELAPGTNYAFIGRAIVGLREPGIGGGAQAFVRIGNDRRTNLVVGGEILGGIGLRGIAQLEWRTIKRVPIVLRTEVTNQPAGVSHGATDKTPIATGQSEVGARTIGQVGYEIIDGLTLSARASYQGRTIQHAGPGAGAAVSYEW